MIIENLITQDENESIDFKVQYFKVFDEIIHDILCLSNSETESNRYIVFGIKDKTKEVIGIENDNYRSKWKDDKLQNWLSQIQFNRKPSIKFEEANYDNHILGILTIKNRYDKPFFLLQHRNKARAGVIYTRNGSTNTPHDETANEVDIERMWRERFGINLGSLARLSLLMNDPTKWVQNDVGIIHHANHPEFYIQDTHHSGRFEKENVYRQSIKIPSPSNGDYFEIFNVYYFSTHITDVHLITFDDCRIIMPSFELKSIDEDNFVIFSSKTSLNYKFFRIYELLNRHSRSFEIYHNSYIETDEYFTFHPLPTLTT